MLRLPSRLVAALLPILLAGCTATTTGPTSGDGSAGLSGVVRPAGAPTDELHWIRSSAEYRAISIQTYRLALEAASKLSAGRAPGTWGVSLDADETVLDNSGYELELQKRGAVHTDEAWFAWVKRRERTAVPGAKTFLEGLRALGGRAAIVTNTQQSLCADVAANLASLGLPYDLLVCRPDGGADRKEGRWKAVADGTARPDLGPVELLLFVGDNIQDFPGQSQALRDGDDGAFASFGVRWFVLPNPVYGTWEKNAPR